MPKRVAKQVLTKAGDREQEFPDELLINADTSDESEDSFDQQDDEDGADTGLTGISFPARFTLKSPQFKRNNTLS